MGTNIGMEGERRRRIGILIEIIKKVRLTGKELDTEATLLEAMRLWSVTRKTARDYLKIALVSLNASA